MRKFKSKPVFVDAEQWLGEKEQVERLLSEEVIMTSAARDGSVLVPTMDGNLTCKVGDYIVTDEKGTRSVVEASVFESTYELVDAVEYVDVENQNVVDAETVAPAVDANPSPEDSAGQEDVAEKIEPTAQLGVENSAGAESK